MQRRYRGDMGEIDMGEIRRRSRSSARPNLTPKTERGWVALNSHTAIRRGFIMSRGVSTGEAVNQRDVLVELTKKNGRRA